MTMRLLVSMSGLLFVFGCVSQSPTRTPDVELDTPTPTTELNTQTQEPVTPTATPTTPTQSAPTPTETAIPDRDLDGDGFTSSGDCDESNPNIYPGAIEVCDQKDNDCDGSSDEGYATWPVYEDLDEDLYGARLVEIRCDAIVQNKQSHWCGDTNDNDPTVYPKIQLGDGHDDDCAGPDNL
jgi:hypothetical protein